MKVLFNTNLYYPYHFYISELYILQAINGQSFKSYWVLLVKAIIMHTGD
jgi:hypothetical protein